MLLWGGRCGGGKGVIFDPGGNIVNSYAWGLEHRSNNEAEWISLILGLEQAWKSNISKITVFGDSRQVIQKVRSDYNHGSPTAG